MFLFLTVGTCFSGSFPGFSVVNVRYDGQCAFSVIRHQLVARNYVSCDLPGDTVRRDVVDCRNEELKAVTSERLTDQTIADYSYSIQRLYNNIMRCIQRIRDLVIIALYKSTLYLTLPYLTSGFSNHIHLPSHILPVPVILQTCSLCTFDRLELSSL